MCGSARMCVCEYVFGIVCVVNCKLIKQTFLQVEHQSWKDFREIVATNYAL